MGGVIRTNEINFSELGFKDPFECTEEIIMESLEDWRQELKDLEK